MNLTESIRQWINIASGKLVLSEETVDPGLVRAVKNAEAKAKGPMPKWGGPEPVTWKQRSKIEPKGRIPLKPSEFTDEIGDRNLYGQPELISYLAKKTIQALKLQGEDKADFMQWASGLDKEKDSSVVVADMSDWIRDYYGRQGLAWLEDGTLTDQTTVESEFRWSGDPERTLTISNYTTGPGTSSHHDMTVKYDENMNMIDHTSQAGGNQTDYKDYGKIDPETGMKSLGAKTSSNNYSMNSNQDGVKSDSSDFSNQSGKDYQAPDGYRTSNRDVKSTQTTSTTVTSKKPKQKTATKQQSQPQDKENEGKIYAKRRI